MNDDNSTPYIFKGPEVLQPAYERSEQNELSELLAGITELSSASGGLSGTQAAVETVRYMKQQGIELSAFNMHQVLRNSFGDPEEVVRRTQNCTMDELDEMFPDEIGDALAGYLAPLFEEK